VLQSGRIEANRVNTRRYDKHEELPYLPKQRNGLFSKKNVLLDFIALYADGPLPLVTNFLIALAHRNKDHVVFFLRKTQHWMDCMPFPDYTVDLSPKRARKNTRARALSRLLKNLCGSQVVSM
jgi:hypothetical protein